MSMTFRAPAVVQPVDILRQGPDLSEVAFHLGDDLVPPVEGRVHRVTRSSSTRNSQVMSGRATSIDSDNACSIGMPWRVSRSDW